MIKSIRRAHFDVAQANVLQVAPAAGFDLLRGNVLCALHFSQLNNKRTERNIYMKTPSYSEALAEESQCLVANASNFALTPPQWGRPGGGQPTQQDKNGGVAC